MKLLSSFFKGNLDRPILGWALYDWANSAFSTTVMAGFFPLFFKGYFSKGFDASHSTAQLGIGNSIGTLMVALSAPVLGKISDEGGLKKFFLGLFCFLGAFFTIALGFVKEGDWFLAILFYVLASLAHASSFAFYDALLVQVSQKKNIHFVSAFGYALGYLGGGVLFLINVMMFQYPEFFGISDSTWAIKISFISVGIWWVIFSLPFFFWVHEKGQISYGGHPRSVSRFISKISESFFEFTQTLKTVKKMKSVFLFLLAFFLYNDGVGTAIRMAVDYGISIGFQDKDLILALLLVQFVGFPSALLIGRWTQSFSVKKIILLFLCMYIFIIFWAYAMNQVYEFFILAILIGFVQGGVQALSRSFFASLIPADRSGEFFGIYNILGRFAGMVGPLLMSVTVLATNNPRFGILSVSILFILGALMLLQVQEPDSLKKI